MDVEEEANETIFTPENRRQVLEVKNFDDFLSCFSHMYRTFHRTHSLDLEYDREHIQNPLISSSLSAKT
jgi:hypothetical protein